MKYSKYSSISASNFAVFIISAFMTVSCLAIVGPETQFALNAVLAAIGCCCIYGSGVKVRAIHLTVIMLPILLILLTSISIVMDLERSIIEDYFEIIKYIGISLFLIIGLNVKIEVSGKKLHASVLVFSILIALFGLGVILFPKYFILIEGFYSRQRFFGKPITFFHTTYFAAAIYALLASYWIFSVRPSDARSMILSAFFSIVFLVLIVFTQSRSAVFGAAILSLIFLVRIWCFNRWPTKVVLVVSLAVAIGVIWQYSDYASQRLGYLISGFRSYVLNWHRNIGRDNSLGLRFAQIEWALNNNPYLLWGAGVGKGYYRLLESWPALYYYRFGLIGMFAYVVFWSFPIARSIQLYVRGYRSASPLFWAIPAFIVTLPFLSLSSVMTDQPHMSAIFYGLLGVYYSNFIIRDLTNG
ncbi:hypothetical protein [Devosia sp. 2618]|uniref:hypothetical protein n=1 Tax=Devosia sp. 2618 TaxID=3156454 RepID=UPI00339934CA